jgi:putative ABC transport system permease protein
MRSVAWSMIRNHKAGFAGVFIAVLFGSAVVTACGILIDSGLRGGFPPERYAAASVVVGAPQSLRVKGDSSQPYSERVPLPAGRVGEIARVPGIAAAVGDVSVGVSLLSPARGIISAGPNQPILAHGWS